MRKSHVGASSERVGANRFFNRKFPSHREHLMAKLDIHDTAGLTRSAGIIESSVQVTII
ncbi:MAG: DNA-binding response regulator [Limisphaerales bacterium]